VGRTFTKTSSLATQDSFASLKSKMKERLELLKKNEVGHADKPQFLVKFEEEECLVKEREEVQSSQQNNAPHENETKNVNKMLKMTQKHQHEAKALQE